MKSILLFLCIISSPVLAELDRPEDMVDQQVPILLHCFPSFARVVELLGQDYQEVPVMMSHMSPTTTMVWFTNKDKSSSTLVVTKSDNNSEQSCIMWNGVSDPGMSFSVNPNPNFPEKGTSTAWNEA
tara:strand:+ start:265 stop:645 length:381 start_codon:yes stop_codon:yes gene_type:complete